MVDIGACFALLHEIRNVIMASVMSGTSADKDRKKSEFFSSYVRRTGAMGVQLCEPLLQIFFMEMVDVAVTGFKITGEMPEEVRQKAQEMIDEYVKKMSKNAPLKI